VVGGVEGDAVVEAIAELGAAVYGDGFAGGGGDGEDEFRWGRLWGTHAGADGGWLRPPGRILAKRDDAGGGGGGV